jgi:hypothetical protein
MRGASLVELAPELVILLGFAAVFLPCSIWALRYAIRHLKETGQLVQY